MVRTALEGWDLAELDYLFIENVGNLVCPASFDLGENLRVLLFPVTEGEDKPLKYPTLINTADVTLISKLDLAEAVGFDLALARRNLEEARPGAVVLEVSGAERRGDRGLDTIVGRPPRPVTEGGKTACEIPGVADQLTAGPNRGPRLHPAWRGERSHGPSEIRQDHREDSRRVPGRPGARLGQSTFDKYETIIHLYKSYLERYWPGHARGIRQDYRRRRHVLRHLRSRGYQRGIHRVLDYFMPNKVLAGTGTMKAAGTVIKKLNKWLVEKGYSQADEAVTDRLKELGRDLGPSQDLCDRLYEWVLENEPAKYGETVQGHFVISSGARKDLARTDHDRWCDDRPNTGAEGDLEIL